MSKASVPTSSANILHSPEDVVFDGAQEEPSKIPRPSSLGLYHDVPTSVRMTIRTPQVALATTPTIVSTLFTHYGRKLKHLTRGRHRKKSKKTDIASSADVDPDEGPTDQHQVAQDLPDTDASAPHHLVEEDDPALIDLAYDEGVKVLKSFLRFAAKHTLEDLQAFTALRLPAPTWVRRRVVHIPYEDCIDTAEQLLEKQLRSYGDFGIKAVGGMKWWKVRGRGLEGEWIEMKRDYVKRQAAYAAPTADPSTLARSERVMLYIHGGAYFFSSLDTHRYQIMRHARKLGGRAFAPNYRLAPQYPFPCGLLDALASYLFLISPPPGADHQPVHPSCILFAGDSAGAGMVISMLTILRDLGLEQPAGAVLLSPWVDLTHSFPSIMQNAKTDYIPGEGFHYRPSLAWPPEKGTILEVANVDGKEPLQIDEQIQLYCPNTLLTHPLVSPVNQGSLGGLCPLLVHSGGGELLRDEQIYLAHKAASPSEYTPSAAFLRDYPNEQDLWHKYPATPVQLQVFDGCAHVVVTLSVTLPAKYMYRSVANFGIWAIIAAQKARARADRKSRQSSTQSSTNKASNQGKRADTRGSGKTETSKDSRITSGSTLYSEPSSGISTRATTPSIEPESRVRYPLPVTAEAHRLAKLEPTHDSDVQSDRQPSPIDQAFDPETSSSTSESDSGLASRRAGSKRYPANSNRASGKVTVQGYMPPFGECNIIRQRVSCHGIIRDMESVSRVPALQVKPDQIGQVLISGPISGWLATRHHYEHKYGKDLQKYREIKEADYKLAIKYGFLTRNMFGEVPPKCALASCYNAELAREIGRSVDEQGTHSSKAVLLYMKMSSKKEAEMVGHYQDASQAAVDDELVRMTTRQRLQDESGAN